MTDQGVQVQGHNFKRREKECRKYIKKNGTDDQVKPLIGRSKLNSSLLDPLSFDNGQCTLGSSQSIRPYYARNKLNTCSGALKKLAHLMEIQFEIADKNHQQVILVSLGGLLKRLNWILSSSGIKVKSEGIRLAGSAASAIICPDLQLFNEDEELEVSDIDINIYVETSRDPTASFFKILQCEEECVASLVEEQTGQLYSLRNICDMFFLEMLKVDTRDEAWSLISIGNGSTNIDIKIIQKTKRCYVFSVDSFEIILDPALSVPNFDKSQDDIYFESMYALTNGDLSCALNNLKNGTLKTRRPEEIKRGIFRLCLELSKGREFDTVEDEQRFTKVVLQQFYEDFSQNLELFRITLEKFLKKHESYSSLFLHHMYDIILKSDFTEKVNFLDIIVNLSKQFNIEYVEMQLEVEEEDDDQQHSDIIEMEIDQPINNQLKV